MEDDEDFDLDLGIVKMETTATSDDENADSESDEESNDSDEHFKPYGQTKGTKAKKFVRRSQSSMQPQGDGIVRKRGRPRKHQSNTVPGSSTIRRGRGRPSLKTKKVSRPIWKEIFSPKPPTTQNGGGGDETPRRGRGRPPKKNRTTSTSEKKERPSLKDDSTPKHESSRASLGDVVNSASKRDRRKPKRYLSDDEEEEDDHNFKTVSPNRSHSIAVPSARTGNSSVNTQNRKRGRPRKSIHTSTRGTGTTQGPLSVFDFESSSDEEEKGPIKLNLGDSPKSLTVRSEGSGSIGVKRGRGRPRGTIKREDRSKYQQVDNHTSSPPSSHTKVNVEPAVQVQRGRGRPPRSSNLNYSARFGMSEDGIKRKLSPIKLTGSESKKLKSTMPTPSLTDDNSSQKEKRDPIIQLRQCDGSSTALKTPPSRQQTKTEEEMSADGRKRGRGRPRKSEFELNTITTATPGSAHLPLKKRGRGRPKNINTHIEEIDQFDFDIRSSTTELQFNHGLEVCVDNIQSIVNAVEGGCTRIELCAALSEGGLTPTVGLLEAGRHVGNVPIFVMIRPRGGDFIYSEQEMQIMETDIQSLKAAGADGFVFGVLNEAGGVDVEKCRRLLKLTSPLPSTFHRAFDMIPRDDIHKSLEAIVGLGFQRILTSGLHRTAHQGIPLLKEMVIAAKKRIIIMAGAGVNPKNVEEIVKQTGVTEVHASARVKIKSRVTPPEFQVSMGNSEDDTVHWETDVILVKEIISHLKAALKELKDEGEKLSSDNATQNEVCLNVSEANISSNTKTNAHSSVMEVACDEVVVQQENPKAINSNDTQHLVTDDDCPPTATVVLPKDSEMESNEILQTQNISIDSTDVEITNENQSQENGDHLQNSSCETQEGCLESKASFGDNQNEVNGDRTNGKGPEDSIMTAVTNAEFIESKALEDSEYVEAGSSESTPAEAVKHCGSECETTNAGASGTFQDENITCTSSESGIAETYANNSVHTHFNQSRPSILGSIDEIDDFLSYPFS